MSNIYLKVTIEKSWHSQTFEFPVLQNSSPDQFFGSWNSRRYHWILKILVTTKKLDVWEQNHVWLFYYFNFERNYGILKVKSPCVLLKKTLIKTKRNRKWKFSYTLLEKQGMYLSSCKNHELKVTLWWVGASERKISAFFVQSLFCPKEIFSTFVFFTQYIFYWINFQNIHTFTYRKALLHTLFACF